MVRALAGCPASVQHGFDLLDVIGTPVVDRAEQLRLRGEGLHVARLAETMDAGLLGRLQHGRAVGVLRQDVGTLGDMHLRGVGFLDRVIPAVDPDHRDRRIRVDRTHAERKGVDALDHFRNREGGEIADLVRLRHLAGDDALYIAAFIEPDVAGGHVRRPLVAGQMDEFHVREFLRDLQRRVHVAEGGGEDHLVALARQLADDAGRIRPLGNVLDEGRLDLVTKMLFNVLTADLVGIGPAMVTRIGQIDEPDLDRVGNRRGDHRRRGDGASR